MVYGPFDRLFERRLHLGDLSRHMICLAEKAVDVRFLPYNRLLFGQCQRLRRHLDRLLQPAERSVFGSIRPACPHRPATCPVGPEGPAIRGLLRSAAYGRTKTTSITVGASTVTRNTSVRPSMKKDDS